MQPALTWLYENRAWIFEGLGVSVLAGLGIVLARLVRKRTPAPAPTLPTMHQNNQQTVNIVLGPGAPTVSVVPSVPALDEIHALLDRVQSGSSVAALLPAALKIALAIGDPELERFAKGEIAGWREIRKKGFTPAHRMTTLYISASQVNFDFIPFQGDARRIMREIESDPKRFRPIQWAWDQPLHDIESMGNPDPGKNVLTFTGMFGDYFANVKPKDNVQVFVYGSASTPAKIVSNVRAELARLLLKALSK